MGSMSDSRKVNRCSIAGKACDMRGDKKHLLYYFITALLLIGIAAYQMGHITGMVLYPDEFGYWANAAGWLGFDWSDTVALQSFYSYGYSLMLLPLLKWIEDPSLLYRLAVMANVLFIYLHAALLWKLAGEMEWGADRERSGCGSMKLLSCLTAAFYPALTFYMQFTLAESLLALLFLLSAWLFAKWDRTQKSGFLFLLLACLAFLYFAHMRTVGILAAGVTACACSCLKKRKEKRGGAAAFLLLLAAFIILLFFGRHIKEALQEGVYRGADQRLIAVNDYGGQLSKLEYLFTAEGLADFLISCCGKLFYLSVATLGTFYFGILHAVKKCRSKPVYLLLLLSAVFTFLVTALYMIRGGRIDGYIYGRYNEMILPVFIYLGLCEMSVNRRLFRTIAALAVFHGAAGALLAALVRGMAPAGYQGYFSVGFSGYLPREILPQAEDYILYPAVLGTAAMVLLGIIMGIFIRRKRAMASYLLLLIGFYLYTGISAGGKYVYDHSIDTGEDMELACRLKQMLGPQDEAVFYLSGSDAHYVDIIQFCLRERPLRIVQAGGNEEAGGKQQKKADCVITYHSFGQAEELEEQYDNVLTTYHFKLYYGGG